MGIPFQRHFNQTIKKRGEHSPAGLWLNTIIVAGFVFLFAAIYTTVRGGGFSLRDVNTSLASAGFIVIGFSMLLSGICYFWNFADTKIIYRKHLGWVGLLMVIGHVGMTLFVLTDRFPFPSYFANHFLPFLFGGGSLIVFLIVASVSNQHAAHELGGVRWRKMLRLVYPAYVLGVAHFIIRSAPAWLTWIRAPQSLLPPLTLLVFLFSLLVFSVRLALWSSLRKKKRAAKTSARTSTIGTAIVPQTSQSLTVVNAKSK